jgi:hypothetical protein
VTLNKQGKADEHKYVDHWIDDDIISTGKARIRQRRKASEAKRSSATSNSAS